MVGVDATVLTLLLNEKADSPPDPATGKPVQKTKERVSFLVQTLHKTKQKLVIPTPVLSEVLVRTGIEGLQYVELLQRSSVFEIRDFDKLAAVELAIMTHDAIKAGDKRSGHTESWQKIKFDRQIVAICKVVGVTSLYASDRTLTSFARENGLTVFGVHDLPLPPESPQLTMHELLERVGTAVDEPKPDEVDNDEPEKSTDSGAG